jgi:nitrogen regulatory protein P-II 1
VQGHGGEPDTVEPHEKVRIDVAVSEPFVEPTIEDIVVAARTGEVGDGKIFVQPLERVIRIRTGEQDVQALTSL